MTPEATACLYVAGALDKLEAESLLDMGQGRALLTPKGFQQWLELRKSGFRPDQITIADALGAVTGHHGASLSGEDREALCGLVLDLDRVLANIAAEESGE